MKNEKKLKLVPYGQITPGHEAIYTGRKAAANAEDVQGQCVIEADEDGNEIEMWSLWSWTGAVKEWLAACLWKNLTQVPAGPGRFLHKELAERSNRAGTTLRGWIEKDVGRPGNR